MKTKLIALFSLLFLFGVVMISCDEESLFPDTPDTQSAEDNSVAETGVARVFESVNNYGISVEGKKSITDGPDTVYWDGNTVTIDYGENGSLTATFNSFPGDSVIVGLEAAVTITNFNVGGTIMNGALTLTVVQISDTIAKTGPIFEIETTDDLKFEDDTVTSTWGGNRRFEWIEGFLTPLDFSDDVFHISGESHGINANGVYYTVVIPADSPLVLTNCDYIVKGIMTITEGEGDDKTEMTLNFGDGTCDSIMIVTIGGVDISVDMSL